jgi:hypothetical protein
MPPIIRLLQAIRNLTKSGAIKTIEDAYRLAKRELRERFNEYKKNIDDAYNQGKKEQTLDKRTKDIKKIDEAGIKSLETDVAEDSIMGQIGKSKNKIEEASNKIKKVQEEQKGIMSTDEGSATLKKIQEDTEKLKEDPKLQEILRSIGVEDAAPLDSAANVRTALKNMEDRMRVGNDESNIRATLREFLERRLKDGTLNIPDARERDAIEKVYQGGVDPIDVFRKAYGEDALIAVDDVFEQYGDKIMRESGSYKEMGDKFEQLFKFNRGFYDMADLPVPKKNYGYDEGLMSNKELVDKLKKDLKEKEMLEDFDPTDRTKNATGGRVQAASGGLAGILKL